MSAWTDARDNVRHGLMAMWDSFSPVVRASIISTLVGFIFGGALALAFLC